MYMLQGLYTDGPDTNGVYTNITVVHVDHASFSRWLYSGGEEGGRGGYKLYIVTDLPHVTL